MQPHLWDPVPPTLLREKAAAAIERQIESSTKRAEKDYLIALNEGTPATVVVDLAEQARVGVLHAAQPLDAHGHLDLVVTGVRCVALAEEGQQG